MDVQKIIKLILGFILLPVLLFSLSFSHIYPLFTGEFTQQLGSIEVSYISMAKFILDFWPNLSWQPLWYFGYPFYLLYTPFVPFLEVFGKAFLGFTPSHAYRFFTALSFCLIPVSLYFLVSQITKNKIGGFFAALFYITLPSLLGYIFPTIADDRLTKLLEPRRIAILVRWGEGPHTVSLVFVPLAALFFYLFLKGDKFRFLILASLFIVLTALTNAVGLWGLAVLLLGIILEVFVTNKTVVKTLTLKLTKVFFLSFGLVLFWYHPSFIKNFFGEGGGTLTYWSALFPWGVLVLIIAAVFYVLILKKLGKNIPGLAAGLTWFLIMFGAVYIYYASGEDRMELVPQALRLNTEADMALAFLGGVVISYFSNLFWKKSLLFRLINVVIIVILFVPLFFQIQLLAKGIPPFTVPIEKTQNKLENTSEYKITRFLQENVARGNRVFAPGNYGFFLDYFTNVAQLRGALFQSSINKWPDHIYYQLVNGESSEIALIWLKIANISHLIYTTGGSGEPFKDYKVPREKFDRILTVIKEENGDIYYKVPLKDTSLAKVVSPEIINIPIPVNAIDKKPLLQYVKLLEKNPGKAKVDFLNNQKFQIEAQVKEGELILVQVSFHNGWKAVNNKGKKLPVYTDPLGFLLINPLEAGTVTLTLSHHAVISQIFGVVVTIITILIIVILIITKFIKKTPAAPKK